MLIYEKPAVDVYQFYKDNTLEAKLTDLPVVLIGELSQEYYRSNLGFYGNVEQDFNIPTDAEGILKEDSIVVEISQRTGDYSELTLGTDYTVSGQVITIVAGLDIRGNVLVSYMDRKTSYKDNFLTINNEAELDREYGPGNDGIISSDNQLLYAAKVHFRASGDTQVYCLNADMDQTGLAAALDIIRRKRIGYYLVPLTNEYWVHAMMKSFVEAMETPEYAFECIAFVAWDFDLTPELLSSDSGVISVGDLNSLADINVNYIYEGISVGDSLVIGTDSFDITTVNDHSIVFSGPGTAATDIVYSVKSHTLSSNEYAIYLSNLSAKTKFRRFVRIFPDEAKLNIEGNLSADGHLPTYYLAAWMAGKHASLVSSDSLTMETIPEAIDLKHSSNYFSESELQTIAAGGNTIIQQDYDNAAVYIRREISSDNSTLEKAEVNITTQADILAKVMRINLKNLLGRTSKMSEKDFQKVLNKINIAATSIIATLADDKVKYIGPGTFVRFVKRDPDHRDRVIICVSLDSYVALNHIDVLIFI